MNKQTLNYPYNRILFNNLKENYQVKKTEKNLKCIMLSERNQPEKPMSCVISLKLQFGKSKTRKSRKISGCRGSGGMNR